MNRGYYVGCGLPKEPPLIFDRITLFLNAQRLLVISFLSAIVLGALLLRAPFIMAGEISPLSATDAAFTATSAVCVTGLIVRDTATEFSFWGQLVILLLIQAGGLGIMTFSNLLILHTGRRLGLRGRMLIEESHGLLPNIAPQALLPRILKYTLLIEGVGALLLWPGFFFGSEAGFFRSIWLSIFHSISAFCNAGFALFSDSLVSFADNPWINLVMMILIVMGGLGFIVYAELVEMIQCMRKEEKPARLSLHSRVVLVTSGLLIGGPATMIFLLEPAGAIGQESLSQLMMESLFMSVTCRTAGFNTVGLASLTNATLLIAMILMVIGGSPGSTAGGIKTTTFATLMAMLRAKLFNRADVEIGDRRLSVPAVTRTVATISIYMIVVWLASMALQLTELYGVSHAEHRGKFLEYQFEVISALSTVGLSLDITPTLSAPGRWIILICMFIGRLGPVLFMSALLSRRSKPKNYSYPVEDILIG